MENETNSTLSKLTEKLSQSPDSLYYYYHGLVFGDSDIFIRLDKTYIYTLSLYRGRPCLQQIHGVKMFDHGVDPFVLFTSKPVYRILNGKRKGRVTTANKVFRNDYRYEETEKLHNPVFLDDVWNSGRPFIEGGSAGTSFIKGIIRSFVQGGEQGTYDSFRVPDLYLSSGPEVKALLLRDTEKASAWIRDKSQSYKSSKSFQQNLTDNMYSLSRDAGKGRRAYPFEYVYGRGVVVVDKPVFGFWMRTDKGGLEYRKPHVKVEMAL